MRSDDTTKPRRIGRPRKFDPGDHKMQVALYVSPEDMDRLDERADMLPSSRANWMLHAALYGLDSVDPDDVRRARPNGAPHRMQVAVYMDPSDVRRVDAEAQRAGMSRARWLRNVLLLVLDDEDALAAVEAAVAQNKRAL